MLGNHLLVKMNWSDNVTKNGNARAPRPAVIFQMKRNKTISYMGMNLLINSIKKVSTTCPIYQMTVTANYTQYFPQQLLHAIFNNQNLSRCKEPIQLWVIAKLTGGQWSEAVKQNFVRDSSNAKSVYRSTIWREQLEFCKGSPHWALFLVSLV